MTDLTPKRAQAFPHTLSPQPDLDIEDIFVAEQIVPIRRVPTGPYNFTYPISRIVRVVDGDTVDLELTLYPPDMPYMDLGFKLLLPPPSYKGRFRLTIVDTPEKGQPGYREATAFTADWLRNHFGPAPFNLQIDTYRDPDNFGRYLGDIYCPHNGHSLSSDLLEHGYARYKP